MSSIDLLAWSLLLRSYLLYFGFDIFIPPYFCSLHAFYHRLEKIITEQNNLRPNTELLEQHKEMPKDSMLPDDEIAWAFPPEGEKHPDFNKELKEEKLLQLDQHGGGFLQIIHCRLL